MIGNERRRRSASSYTPAEALPIAVSQLSDIVHGIWSGSRLTVVSLADTEVRVVSSTGADPMEAGTTLATPLAADLRRILQQDGSIVLDVDDVDLSGIGSSTLAGFRMKRAILLPLHGTAEATVCVVVDQPGRRMEFGPREKTLLQAAVAQAAAALESAGLRSDAARRQRTLEAITRLGVIFTSALDLAQTAAQVVEYTALLLELPAVALLYRHEGAEDFRMIAAEGLPLDVRGLSVKPIEIASLDIEREGQTSGGLLPECASGSLFEHLRGMGLGNTLVAPLVVGTDRLQGVLLGLDRRNIDPDDERRDLFHLLAMQATNAIWNAERYEAEVKAQLDARRELKTTALLLRSAGLLAESLDLDAMLRGAAEVIAQAVGRLRVVLSLYEPSTDELVIAAVAGERTMIPGTRISISELAPQVRTSMVQKHTEVVDYGSPGVPEENRKRAEGLGTKRALSVPMVFKGDVIGHIGLDEPGVRREFTRREIDIIEGIASQAAVAVENARLYAGAQHRADTGRVLAEAAASLASSMDAADVMPEVLSAMSASLGASGGALARREPGGWRTSAVHGLPIDLVGEFHSDSESPTLSRVAEKQEPVLVTDVGRSEHVDRPRADRVGYRSYISYPVKYRDEVVAAITFFFERVRGHFTEEEKDFIARLAFMVGVVEENNRLHSAEHMIAETLQEALLEMPSSLTGIEFAHAYHSASEAARVGGDFYDIFELNQHHVGVTIGDVAGKGLEAAVLTSLAKNTIRAHASEKGKTPTQILRLTNDVIFKSTSSEAFVTVFFAILDRRDGRLVYANAGHTTSALVREDGTTSKLRVTGPFLGAFDDAVFEQGEACLELDELLFLYTDGLTEARGDGSFYGEDRLFRLLSATKDGAARDVVGEAIADIMSFTRDNLNDDLAILALKRLEYGADTPVQQKLQM